MPKIYFKSPTTGSITENVVPDMDVSYWEGQGWSTEPITTPTQTITPTAIPPPTPIPVTPTSGTTGNYFDLTNQDSQTSVLPPPTPTTTPAPTAGSAGYTSEQYDIDLAAEAAGTPAADAVNIAAEVGEKPAAPSVAITKEEYGGSKSWAINTTNEAFFNRYGRYPTRGELDTIIGGDIREGSASDWLNRAGFTGSTVEAAAEEETPAETQKYFYSGAELESNLNQNAVNALYQAYFDRDATQAELDNWTGSSVRGLEDFLRGERTKYGYKVGEPLRSQEEVRGEEGAGEGTVGENIPSLGISFDDIMNQLGLPNYGSADEIMRDVLNSSEFKYFSDRLNLRSLNTQAQAAATKDYLETKFELDKEKLENTLAEKGLSFSGIRGTQVRSIAASLTASKLEVDRALANKLLDFDEDLVGTIMDLVADEVEDAKEGRKEALGILADNGLTIDPITGDLVPSLEARKAGFEQNLDLLKYQLDVQKEARLGAGSTLGIDNSDLQYYLAQDPETGEWIVDINKINLLSTAGNKKDQVARAASAAADLLNAQEQQIAVAAVETPRTSYTQKGLGVYGTGATTRSGAIGEAFKGLEPIPGQALANTVEAYKKINNWLFGEVQ